MNEAFFYPLKAITDLLEDFSVPYMLTGGLSQNVYIKPRIVKDIDIVINITNDHLDKILPSLNNHFEFRKVHRKIHFCGMFNIIHSETQKKIDIIICKTNEFNKLEFQNKTSKNILGLDLNCVTIEDLIISKISWLQKFRMEKYFDDLTQLFCYHDLDWEYIKYWCQSLNLETYHFLSHETEVFRNIARDREVYDQY
jgi:hypothetical protein